MKALHFLEHGGIDKLKFGEVLTPQPDTNEVLIKVKACGLNRLDLWVLNGWKGLNLSFPDIGGADIAGEIAEAGSKVNKKWKTGTRVIVNPGYTSTEDKWTKAGEDSLSPNYHIFGETTQGGFAEYVTVPEKNLVEIPPKWEYTDACSSLLVGLTAWRMLKVRGQLRAGQTVLIVGAGGGLNSFCIQLAKLFGAKVIALTSSKEKVKKATDLGASVVINYKDKPDWHKAVLIETKGNGADIIVDNVGAQTFEKSMNVQQEVLKSSQLVIPVDTM